MTRRHYDATARWCDDPPTTTTQRTSQRSTLCEASGLPGLSTARWTLLNAWELRELRHTGRCVCDASSDCVYQATV
jgi:hypothetical protein